jgi:Tol biopolymer transport system component
VRRHGSAATEGSTHRPAIGFDNRLVLWLAPLLAVAFLTLVQSASATEAFKFKEVFGSAAQPTFTNPTGLAVDQGTGDLLVMDRGAGTISRFKPNGEPDDFSALGTNVISGTPGGPLVFGAASEAEVAVDNSGTATDGNIYVTQGSPPIVSVFAESGEFLGDLTATGSEPIGFACGVAVGPDGAVYVGDYDRGEIHKFVPAGNPPLNSDAVASFPQNRACQVAVGTAASAGSLFSAIWNFTLQKLDAATGTVAYDIAQGEGTVTTTVAPESGDVLHAKGNEVTEYNASGPAPAVKVAALSLASNVQGVAVGPGGTVYVSREPESGLEAGIEVWDLVSTPTVEASPPSGVAPGKATLNGTVNPEGSQLIDCRFEFGPITTTGFDGEAPCSPPAAAIPPISTARQVSAAVSGLQANTTYKFRLSATNANGTEISKTLTFATFGPPQISDMRARDANQASATLEAKINPSGASTSYRFEWGPTTSYGHSIPADFEPFVGSGTEPVRVTAKVTGLSTGSLYHYRVVAGNGNGTTESPDRIFETLNSCGLPRQRCFELVSPREAGPVAKAGNVQSQSELAYQAAPDSGALAYVVETGFPGVTRGAEILYRGTRGSGGWSSTQFSAPFLAPSETNTTNSNSSQTLALSPDLSCGIEVSDQPLTSDASTRPVVEAGGSNLYRHNPNGSYTAITNLTPTNFEETQSLFGVEYDFTGVSEDCGKIVFYTEHIYPGVPGKGEIVQGENESRLYEWDEGELRTVGWVPGPDGEVAVVAEAGDGGFLATAPNRSNTVSEDGDRVFFSAERQTGPNPAEIGQRAIFVREDGVTRDLSMSETATPATQVTYQHATNDGSRVYFTAIAGLTAESSGEGIDLYEYDLETEDLTDLSVDNDGGGAQVGGFVGASADGTHVYFAARGQLVPELGKTFVQNVDADTYSLYGASSGQVEYVGTVTGSEATSTGGVTMSSEQDRSSRVSPDGKYLLFETIANVTGYESGGPRQAYLYSASDKSTVCVSCRPDGQPSLPASAPLVTGREAVNPLYQPATLIVRGGEPSVFFFSSNRLASGGVEGLHSLYEWSHHQVFAIDTEPPGLNPPGSLARRVQFAGASADGSDLYLATPNTLTWEDGDERSSVYDARIGGGNPEPPGPPAPCNPAEEGSCQGSQAPPAVIPGAASPAFHGPGNAKPKKSKKRQRKHHKKHHKKSHRKKKHQKAQSNKTKHANGNRRAGK